MQEVFAVASRPRYTNRRHAFAGLVTWRSLRLCPYRGTQEGQSTISLAEALEAQGKVELALQNVRTACRLADQHKDSRLATFQEHLEALTSKAAGR